MTSPPTSTTVPSIVFQPKVLALDGIEFVSLESLQDRSFALDHSPEEPHRVEFHLLIYIQKGSGAHFVDFNRHPFSAGSFISIHKNQVHAFDFSAKPTGHLILFTQEFRDSIRSNIRLPNFLSNYTSDHQAPVHTVSGRVKTSCENLIQEMFGLTGDEAYDPLLAQLLFSTLSLKLYRNKPSQFLSDITEMRAAKFTTFIALIDQHFVVHKDASEYANMMGMTYKTLNQLCKSAVNLTPKQLINSHVTLEAKRRLAIQDIRIQQLAFELGFEDVSNFTKFFKKQTLQTPREFKNSIDG